MGDRKGGKAETPEETAQQDDGETKLKRKDYEKELDRLHVELVKLQEWVRHEGQKVCIIFEGRDGAGKGGTIKAITARVSPRIFRVIALPAPTEREKSQMYVQRYLPHLPAGGGGRDLRPQLVQSRRRRTGHGLLHGGPGEALPRRRSERGKGHHRVRRDPDQVLARGEPRRADEAAGGAHR